MAVILRNSTVNKVGFQDLEWEIPAGIGQTLQISIDDYLSSAAVQQAIASSTISLVAASLTDAEKILIGYVASTSTAATPNETSDFVYKQPPDPAAGQISTIKVYASGAAPGAPVKLSTFTYGDALYPTKVTKIVVSDTTL